MKMTRKNKSILKKIHKRQSWTLKSLNNSLTLSERGRKKLRKNLIKRKIKFKRCKNWWHQINWMQKCLAMQLARKGRMSSIAFWNNWPKSMSLILCMTTLKNCKKKRTMKKRVSIIPKYQKKMSHRKSFQTDQGWWYGMKMMSYNQCFNPKIKMEFKIQIKYNQGTSCLIKS